MNGLAKKIVQSLAGSLARWLGQPEGKETQRSALLSARPTKWNNGA